MPAEGVGRGGMRGALTEQRTKTKEVEEGKWEEGGLPNTGDDRLE